MKKETPIHFSKMQSLGNDFMVVERITQSFPLTPALIQQWSNRHTGIGFDQCLVLEPSSNPDIDFFYRIYNADGSEVGQCGNGARCLARFIEQKGLSHKKTLKVATSTTILTLTHQGECIDVHFEAPHFPTHAVHTIDLPAGEQVSVYTLDVGNPHAVLLVEDLQHAEVARLGKLISEHPYFPAQTNVEFMHLVSPECIQLRVFERGCGETQACGSGALAAAVMARKHFAAAAEIEVQLPGGSLRVKCADLTEGIILTGPAEFVYEGVITYLSTEPVIANPQR